MATWQLAQLHRPEHRGGIVRAAMRDTTLWSPLCAGLPVAKLACAKGPPG